MRYRLLASCGFQYPRSGSPGDPTSKSCDSQARVHGSAWSRSLFGMAWIYSILDPILDGQVWRGEITITASFAAAQSRFIRKDGFRKASSYSTHNGF